MRALKVLVAVMTLLIIAGVIGIVVIIAGRLSTPSRKPPLAALGGPGGPVTVALPPGGHVAGMAGVGERLVLRVERPGADDTLLVIDPGSGAVLQTMDLSPNPAKPVP